jgi:sulfite exporter TauE/SafE
MCGPIALVVGGQNKDRIWSSTLLYNLGRIVTYALMGVAFGLIGKGINMAGMQKVMSIFLGVMLLVLAVASFSFESKLLKISFVNDLMSSVKVRLAQFLKKNSLNAYFSVGLLNGLLPCGLVYMAIAGALSTGSALSGLLYMAFFGLGTVPLMAASTVAGKFASMKVRNFINKLYPVFLIILGVLFLMRGFNFNLPSDFLLWNNIENAPKCH